MRLIFAMVAPKGDCFFSFMLHELFELVVVSRGRDFM